MSEATSLAAQQLATERIGKLLMQYSVPAIIASVATSLYNIIDSMFIGQGVGAMAIAGLAITFPLMNLVIGFCTLVAIGGATISSIFLGQKNEARATETVNTVMVLCVLHSVVFGGAAYVFMDEVLTLFGATANTLPYAREFMSVILLFSPISYIFIGLNNIMRATGYPRKAMYSALITVFTNLALAPIFIFSFKWGIGGAAFATICGQAVGLVWVLAHFMSKKSLVHFNFRVGFFNPQVIKRVYAIGMSPFLMNTCACFVVVFINKSLLTYAGDFGDTAVGAYGILNRTAMCFVMIVLGVAQGMQPILGFNFGAGNWPRVKSTLMKGVWAGLGVTMVGAILAELFPSQLTRMFTTDPTMIDMATHAYRVYFTVFGVVGPQIVITNYFQSIGKPKMSIFLSLTRQLIFLVPLLALLPPKWGVDGIWYSMMGSDVLALAMALAVLVLGVRKYNRNYAETTSTQA